MSSSSIGYGKAECEEDGLPAGEGLCTSMRGLGTGMVSYLPYPERGFDVSRPRAGGKVVWRSTSEIGKRPRPGEGGSNLLE